MASLDMLKVLYSKRMSPLEFKWEMLKAPPLLSLMTPMDIYELNKIATSIKLSTKVQQKYSMIDRILVNRGFKEIASGTNRVCYKYLNDQSICIKVAIDKVGMRDNPAEYKNQYLLAPFVTKMFEMSPCGTVGLFERVEPITCREEFLQISDDVFDLIVEKIIGKYVVQDIGSDFFQNFGLRVGWGPVILDFPYVYELDGNKMLCTKKDSITGEPCLGEIDYDNGFNNLVCTKCGKIYLAKQLEKQVADKSIIIKRGDIDRMRIQIMRGNTVVRDITIGAETKSVPINQAPTKPVVYTESTPKRSKKDKPLVRHDKPQNLNTTHRGEPEYYKEPVQQKPVSHSIPQTKPQPAQTQPADNSEVLWTNHYYCSCGKFYGKKNIDKLCRVCNTPVKYHDEVIKFKPREKEEPKQEVQKQPQPVQEPQPTQQQQYVPEYNHQTLDPEPEAVSVTPSVKIVRGEGESAEVVRDTSSLGYTMGDALQGINLNQEPEEEPKQEECNSAVSVNDYAPSRNIPGKVQPQPEEDDEDIDDSNQLVEVGLDKSKMENVGKSWDNPLHVNELQITYDEAMADLINQRY